MFSFQKLDHQNVLQDGVLRGSPLLSYLTKHNNNNNTSSSKNNNNNNHMMKIRSVHSCAGHFAVMINDQKTCFLLDHVPSSILSSQTNESTSLQLFNDSLLTMNEESSSSSSKSIHHHSNNMSSTVHTNSSSSSSSSSSGSSSGSSNMLSKSPNSSMSSLLFSTGNSMKKNWNKFLMGNNTNNNNNSNNNSNNHSIENATLLNSNNNNNNSNMIENEPLRIYSNGSSSNSILCFGDVTCPLISVFFHTNNKSSSSRANSANSRQSSKSGESAHLNESSQASCGAHHMDTYLFALQQNGNLWIWHFDEVLYVWNCCGCRKLIDPFASSSSSSSLNNNSGGSSDDKLHVNRQSGDRDDVSEEDVNSRTEKSVRILNAAFVPSLQRLVWTQMTTCTRRKKSSALNKNDSADAMMMNDLKQNSSDNDDDEMMEKDIVVSVMTAMLKYEKSSTTAAATSSSPLFDIGPVSVVRTWNSLPTSNEMIRGDMSQCVLDLQPSKNGFWMFTPDNIQHISLDVDGHYPSSVIPGVHIRHFVQFMTTIETLKPAPTVTQAAESNSESSVDNNSNHQNSTTPDQYYVAHYVHPSSRELVLLDMNCEVHVIAPSTMTQTVLSVRKLKQPITQFSIDEKINLYKKLIVHYDQAKKSPATTPNTILTLRKQAAQCRQGTFVELFFMHNTILSITDQESITMYEPKTCAKLGQAQLPNEIALDDKFYSQAGAKSIVWQFYGPNQRPGLFSSSSLYYIKCPPMADLLKQTVDQLAAVSPGWNIRDHDLYHIANRAKQWGLEPWYVKYVLKLVIQDAEQMQKKNYLGSSKQSTNDTPSNSSNLMDFEANINTKKKLLQELTEKLENPSLVWTATKSLAEQKHILSQVAQFLMHFPCPDSSFWKTEKQTHLSQTLQQKFKSLSSSSNVSDQDQSDASCVSQWDQLMNEVSNIQRSDITPFDIYDKMTPLNLSIVPTLAKSLSLSKEQIDNFSEELPSFSRASESEAESSLSRVATEKSIDQSVIKNLSAIELEDLARQQPLPVLRALCELCGLTSFLDYIDNKAVPSQEMKFCPSKSNLVLGYTIPDHTGINMILLDNFELSHDELLAQFDPACMSRPMTQLEAVSPDLAFNRDNAASDLISNHANATYFSSFNVFAGCNYFEILGRLLFESTQHPALIVVLISMIHRCHIDQMKKEIEKLEAQLNKMLAQPNKSVSEQVRKHLLDLQRQKINHLNKFMNTKDAVFNSSESIFKTFYSSRALELLHSVYYSSDMLRFDSLKSGSSDSGYTNEQLLTICQMLLWNGQVLPAIQLLLPKQLDEHVVNVLRLYVIQQQYQSNSPLDSVAKYELDYQSIQLSHEQQCELVHILTGYCINQHNEKRDSELWSLVWDLIPMSYNPFEFIKQFERVNNHSNNDEVEDFEPQPTQRCNMFAARSTDTSAQSGTLSMEELIDNLQNKFVTRTSIHNLF